MNKQEALSLAIGAASHANTLLEQDEFEAGFHWTALADTWANIAGQLLEVPRPPTSSEEIRNGMSKL